MPVSRELDGEMGQGVLLHSFSPGAELPGNAFARCEDSDSGYRDRREFSAR